MDSEELRELAERQRRDSERLTEAAYSYAAMVELSHLELDQMKVPREVEGKTLNVLQRIKLLRRMNYGS